MMRLCASLIAISWMFLAGPPAVQAANKYWDINGATAGAGGASPAGTWNSSNTLWSTSSAGSSATAAWTAGDKAIFSAGNDATGSFLVTLTGTQDASGGVTIEEGTVSFATGVVAAGAGPVTVGNGA